MEDTVIGPNSLLAAGRIDPGDLRPFCDNGSPIVVHAHFDNSGDGLILEQSPWEKHELR